MSTSKVNVLPLVSWKSLWIWPLPLSAGFPLADTIATVPPPPVCATVIVVATVSVPVAHVCAPFVAQPPVTLVELV
ncbi:hypothetical protein D3C83_214850 [compost metagenome]